MIKITIKEKAYKIRNNWSEILIREAGEIMALDVPDTLRAVYYAEGEKEIKKAMKNYDPETYRSYFIEVLSVLSNIPRKVLESVSNLTEVFNLYVEHIPVDLLRFEPYSFQPVNITEFKFKGTYYYLPTAKELFNDTQPLSDGTVEQVLEALDINANQSAMGVDGLSGLVALLAREQGEVFSEPKALIRGAVFKDLPMSIFWEVFFCLKDLSNGVSAVMTSYSVRVRGGLKELGDN